ncbi:MAG: YqiJ family protein [Betaproteobacteria bacterium]|nr:YqiJ family protein [Betaproteobacteria bacterium]
MIDWFISDATWIFSLAILVMLGLGLLELIGLMMGASPSSWFDSFFDTDIDAGADGIDHSLLGWLHLGRVPFLVLLVIFLAAFGVCGLALQWLLRDIIGVALPALIAAIPALVVAVPVTRVVGGLFARILPKEESSAVSRDSLVGRVAVITGKNPATAGLASEARVKDAHERTHYVLVEPEEPFEQLNGGSEVLLVRRRGARFMAIPNPHAGIMSP